MNDLTRETWGWGSLERLGQDLSYAGRIFARTPTFTAVAVLTLALGIGISVALFSVLNALFLQPLPFRDPAMVFALWERPPRTVQWKHQTIPSPLFFDWQRQASSVEEIAGFLGRDFTLIANDRPERVRGDVVTPNLFTLLGLTPALGRTLLPSDANGAPVVLLSHGLWMERFGGNPAVVGTSVTVNDLAHTVVGVLPRETGLPVLEHPAVLWTVLQPSDPELADRSSRLAGIARLRRGVAPVAVQSELAAMQRTFQQQQPASQRAEGVIVRGLQDDRVEQLRPTLLLVASAVAAVLLIACANVASLLLGRCLERTREMSVRAALGAGRGRLIRQLATELVLLWSVGGVLGIAIAAWAVRWFLRHQPFGAGELPAQSSIGIDARVVLFACGLTLATALVFGFLSALQGSRLELVASLKGTGRGTSSSRSTRRWRTVLVAAEVALSVMLLAGAALLITSLARLASQPLGFEPDGVLTFRIQLPEQAYPTDAQRIQFQRALLAKLRALPGVEAVGSTSARALGDIVAVPFMMDGQSDAVEGAPVWSGQQAVDPDYFRAMGIVVEQGRAFDEHDTESSEPVVIINEMLARKYFPDGSAVGRRMKHGTPTSPLPWMRIVGVVGNVKHNGLEWDFLPESFVPYPQISGRYAKIVAKDIIVALRARHDAAALQKAVQTSVHALDNGLPIVDMISAPDLVAATTERPRFRTWLVATFAVIALLLASVGLYGVVSQAVAQRTREIGIRMALGATRASVVRLVVGWGLVVAAVGTLVGMAATFAAGRIIQSLLYGVGAYDPRTVATVVAVMFVVAAVASLIPAQRATSIDPLDTLRVE